MPTTVAKAVGTASRDYSLLQSAHDAQPSSLVTADQAWVFNLYNDSEFAANPPLSVSGKATDATHTQTWQAATGQAFNDNAGKNTNALTYNASNGVAIRLSGGALNGAIECASDYVTFTDLQIGGGGGEAAFGQTAANSNVLLQRCIGISGESPSSSASFILNGGVAVNCLGIATGGGNGFLDFNNSSLRNCSAVAPGGSGNKGFRGNYTAPLYLNNASFGFTTPFANTSNGSNDYNASDGAAPGTHVLTSKVFASQYQDTTGDFRLKTGADLIGAGTRDATYTGDLDILKNARSTSTPAIGCVELAMTLTARRGLYLR